MGRGARSRTSAGEAGARKAEGGAWGGASPDFFSGRAACARKPGTVARAEGCGRRAAMGRGWGLLVVLLGVVWLLRSGHSEEGRPETAAQRCFCQVRRAGDPRAVHLRARAILMRGPHRVPDRPPARPPCDGLGRLASLSHCFLAFCHGCSRFTGSGGLSGPGTSRARTAGDVPSLSVPDGLLGETSYSLGLAVVVKRLNDLAGLFGCLSPTVCGCCCL